MSALQCIRRTYADGIGVAVGAARAVFLTAQLLLRSRRHAGDSELVLEPVVISVEFTFDRCRVSRR